MNKDDLATTYAADRLRDRLALFQLSCLLITKLGVRVMTGIAINLYILETSAEGAHYVVSRGK